MNRFVFSSADLPAQLDDPERFRLWYDIYAAHWGECDIARQRDRPFFAHSEIVQIGEIGLSRFEATFDRMARNTRQTSADPRDNFLVAFNRGGRQGHVQRGREVVDEGGGALFFANTEAQIGQADGRAAVVGLCVPRALVLEQVPNAEDLLGTLLDRTNPATRHLGRYLDFLLASDDLGDGTHIGTVLVDLVALALGARRDAADLAHMRGLRAARVQAIVAEISAGFANPAFTARDVAVKLRLAPHYVQNLLSETGVSFTERVLEQRLQRARAMLARPQGDRMRIGEIAWACGFNDVSYFNRCFRRRFGASPTEYRVGRDNGKR